MVAKGAVVLGEYLTWLKSEVIKNAPAKGEKPADFPVHPIASLFSTSSVSFVSVGVLGAITGSSIGMARAQNPVVLGMNMGLNGSIAGLSFFSE